MKKIITKTNLLLCVALVLLPVSRAQFNFNNILDNLPDNVIDAIPDDVKDTLNDVIDLLPEDIKDVVDDVIEELSNATGEDVKDVGNDVINGFNNLPDDLKNDLGNLGQEVIDALPDDIKNDINNIVSNLLGNNLTLSNSSDVSVALNDLLESLLVVESIPINNIINSLLTGEPLDFNLAEGFALLVDISRGNVPNDLQNVISSFETVMNVTNLNFDDTDVRFIVDRVDTILRVAGVETGLNYTDILSTLNGFDTQNIQAILVSINDVLRSAGIETEINTVTITKMVDDFLIENGLSLDAILAFNPSVDLVPLVTKLLNNAGLNVGEAEIANYVMIMDSSVMQLQTYILNATERPTLENILRAFSNILSKEVAEGLNLAPVVTRIVNTLGLPISETDVAVYLQIAKDVQMSLQSLITNMNGSEPVSVQTIVRQVASAIIRVELPDNIPLESIINFVGNSLEIEFDETQVMMYIKIIDNSLKELQMYIGNATMAPTPENILMAFSNIIRDEVTENLDLVPIITRIVNTLGLPLNETDVAVYLQIAEGSIKALQSIASNFNGSEPVSVEGIVRVVAGAILRVEMPGDIPIEGVISVIGSSLGIEFDETQVVMYIQIIDNTLKQLQAYIGNATMQPTSENILMVFSNILRNEVAENMDLVPFFTRIVNTFGLPLNETDVAIYLQIAEGSLKGIQSLVSNVNRSKPLSVQDIVRVVAGGILQVEMPENIPLGSIISIVGNSLGIELDETQVAMYIQIIDNSLKELQAYIGNSTAAPTSENIFRAFSNILKKEVAEGLDLIPVVTRIVNSLGLPINETDVAVYFQIAEDSITTLQALLGSFNESEPLSVQMIIREVADILRMELGDEFDNGVIFTSISRTLGIEIDLTQAMIFIQVVDNTLKEFQSFIEHSSQIDLTPEDILSQLSKIVRGEVTEQYLVPVVTSAINSFGLQITENEVLTYIEIAKNTLRSLQTLINNADGPLDVQSIFSELSNIFTEQITEANVEGTVRCLLVRLTLEETLDQQVEILEVKDALVNTALSLVGCPSEESVLIEILDNLREKAGPVSEWDSLFDGSFGNIGDLLNRNGSSTIRAMIRERIEDRMLNSRVWKLLGMTQSVSSAIKGFIASVRQDIQVFFGGVQFTPIRTIADTWVDGVEAALGRFIIKDDGGNLENFTPYPGMFTTAKPTSPGRKFTPFKNIRDDIDNRIEDFLSRFGIGNNDDDDDFTTTSAFPTWTSSDMVYSTTRMVSGFEQSTLRPTEGSISFFGNIRTLFRNVSIFGGPQGSFQPFSNFGLLRNASEAMFDQSLLGGVVGEALGRVRNFTGRLNTTVARITQAFENRTASLRNNSLNAVIELQKYRLPRLILTETVRLLDDWTVLEPLLRDLPADLSEGDIDNVKAMVDIVKATRLFSQLAAQLLGDDVTPAPPARVKRQAAGLTDIAAAILNLGRALLQNAINAAISTIQTNLLADPVALMTGILNAAAQNDSILAGILPVDTIATITNTVTPLLQATDAIIALTEVFSSSYNTSQRCGIERAAVTTGLGNFDIWALTFIDAMGKPMPGFLQGNTYLVGGFDQCVDLEGITASGDVIKGQYVRYKFKVNLPLPATAGAIPFQETGLPYINWHLCLPAGCSGDDVSVMGGELAGRLGMSLARSEIVEMREPGTDPVFIAAVITFGALALLCLAGTAVDVTMTSLKDSARKYAVQSSKSRKSSRPKSESPVREAGRRVEEEVALSPTGERLHKQSDFRDARLQQIAASLQDLGTTPTQHASRRVTGAPAEQAVAQPMADYRPPFPIRFLVAFSLYSNVPDVLRAEHGKGDITCLHGIRVLSISWVIIGHNLVFAPQFGNISTIAALTQTWPYAAVMSAPFAVDTFFLLSGCLVAFLFLRSAKKAGGVKPFHMVLYYVHRYLRLTPLFGLAMLFYVGIAPYLEFGPFMTKLADREIDCGKLWWQNLLYISNLRSWYADEPAAEYKLCVGWSWYLPNDMQFYAIAPLVLVPLAMGWRVVGLLMAFLQLACHLVMTAWMQEKYNGSTGYRNSTDHFVHVYIKPWTRCGPYAIGLVLGYVLHATKRKVNMNWAVNLLGWVMACGVGSALVYLLFDNFKEAGIAGPTWSDGVMNAYEIVSRPLWAMCVGWVVFACATGHGGVVNSILSWPGWIPFSRLTFGTYLVHVMVMIYFNNNAKVLSYFSLDFMAERFLAVFLISYGISFVWSLLIETPVRNLIKPANKPQQNLPKKSSLKQQKPVFQSTLDGYKGEKALRPAVVAQQNDYTGDAVAIMSFGPEAGDAARMYPTLQGTPYDEPIISSSRKSSTYATISRDGTSKKVKFDDEQPEEIVMTSQAPPDIRPREFTKSANSGIYPNMANNNSNQSQQPGNFGGDYVIETEVPGGVVNLGFAAQEMVYPSAPPISRPESEVSDVMQFTDDDLHTNDDDIPREVTSGVFKVMGAEVTANVTSGGHDNVTFIQM